MSKAILKAIFLVACVALVSGNSIAQSNGPKFEVDPTFPGPLPENWAVGQVSGVCVDAQDNVFIVNRNNITDKEAEVAQQAPPYIEFATRREIPEQFWRLEDGSQHDSRLFHRLPE